ncbi:MAG: hypothetical protein ABJC04_12050 [Verrucomicrobiota bacterium]
MKFFATIFALCLFIFTGASQAAQNATARVYCLSIRFSQGEGDFNLSSLDLTGITSGINGELYPVDIDPPSHFTSLILHDEIFDEDIPGSMALDVPRGDADGDGFPDIFDTAKSFSGSSSGSHAFVGSPTRNVTATWSRSAGSAVGTCTLDLQTVGMFVHTFEILEYKGTLNYTPGSNVVTAQVDLSQSGTPGNQWKGPINFTKSPGDPYNVLMHQSGTWTNNAADSFSFVSDLTVRDVIWPTNYFGYVEFADGILSTTEPDYYLWFISIDDLNDTDGDGIPDFSDDPPTVTVNRPLLALQLAPTNLSLTITGNIGQICEIQEAVTINAVNWPTISTVTLTNTSQTVSLPLPSTQTKFWRVRVP